MNDDQKQTTALATATTLTDDHLLAIADAAEKRVEAVKKIKILALRVTNPQDWIDQNGKPYLQVSGAEKIARLFGISWQLEPPDIDFDDERHFMWTFKGTFSMGTAEIEAIGTRSSKDAFFSRSHGRDIPPTEIDRGDVKKAAFTNCIGNGVTRLLGLRNLTWAEVGQAGVNQATVSKVDYKHEARREDGAEPSSESEQDIPQVPPSSYEDEEAWQQTCRELSRHYPKAWAKTIKEQGIKNPLMLETRKRQGFVESVRAAV